MSSHADQHDLDKLGRWHRDLSEGPKSGFPAYAVFLVSADDRQAHDIFRQFRSSFEARNAGFQHLVIFGQHGISTTAQSLLAELGLSQDSLPTLAVVSEADTGSVYTLRLPSGANEATPDEGLESEAWQKVLATVEAAADSPGPGLDLAEIPGVSLRSWTTARWMNWSAICSVT